MAHWHDDNPWADRATYVRLSDLAECAADGYLLDTVAGRMVENTPQRNLMEWLAASGSDGKLDAYLIPGQYGPSAGVRFGPNPEDYLSPLVRDREKAEQLIRDAQASAAPNAMTP